MFARVVIMESWLLVVEARSRRLPLCTLLCLTPLILVILMSGCSSRPSSAPLTASELESYRAVLRERWDADSIRATQVLAEEQVAECMADLGFSYVPEVPADDDPPLPFEGTDEDFARAYGFGISIPSVPDANSPEESDKAPLMSEAEALAYAEALYGPMTTSDASTATTPLGCQEQGYARAFPPSVNSAAEPVFDELQLLMEQLPEGPAMVALDHEWSMCMETKGQPAAASPRGVVESVEAGYAELLQMVEVQPGVFEAVADKSALTTFQDAERKLATASAECRTFVDYETREGGAIRELENDFVARHRKELDAWLAWYQEQHG